MVGGKKGGARGHIREWMHNLVDENNASAVDTKVFTVWLGFFFSTSHTPWTHEYYFTHNPRYVFFICFTKSGTKEPAAHRNEKRNPRTRVGKYHCFAIAYCHREWEIPDSCIIRLLDLPEVQTRGGVM